jgi:hypothetical protein
MQGVTLTIAAIFSLLALTLRPSYALAAYATALLWYPPYLAVSIGTIDILVSRIVVAVLLLRCLCDDQIRSKFTWSRLDTLVALSMVLHVVTFFFTDIESLAATIENRGGYLMDTWFAYMAARFIVTDRAKLISVIKCISIVLVPLAILGVVESVTGWQPFAPLRRFSPWFRGAAFVSQQRFGFARAIGPFSHAILFGGGFAMFLPLIWYLRHQRNDWRPLAYVLSGVAMLGALSSMSSGPWLMVMVVIFCLALERHRNWVKPLLAFGVFSCIFIAIASNRPFYHVIASWANPLGGAGWHRAMLIDCAIRFFHEWWLVGYGQQDPGWGPYLGMAHTDVTNEFILAGVKYGILGIIALCAVLVQAFRGIISTYKKMIDPVTKSLCWAFGSLLFAVVITWMSVSFFGQLASLFYCVLGVMGSLSNSSFNWQVPNRLAPAQHHMAGTLH